MYRGGLSDRVSATGFKPQHAAEVGVGSPDSSALHDYISRGVRCLLVEPNPTAVAAIRAAWGNCQNVNLFNLAIAETRGTASLALAGPSSFVSTLPNSPAIAHGEAEDLAVLSVSAAPFADIDDGTIDLLHTDAEGSEWYVLRTLRSRPAVISLETHGKTYRNPFRSQIAAWMKANDYRLWYLTRSDSVYVRDQIPVSIWDRAALIRDRAFLALRRSFHTLLRR